MSSTTARQYLCAPMLGGFFDRREAFYRRQRGAFSSEAEFSEWRAGHTCRESLTAVTRTHEGEKGAVCPHPQACPSRLPAARVAP